MLLNQLGLNHKNKRDQEDCFDWFHQELEFFLMIESIISFRT